MRKIILIAILVCAAGAIAVPAVSASSTPVRLSFDKTATAPGVWHGTVSGDIDGALTTQLLSLRVTGPIWHVTFDWIVDAGTSSFTARLSGILNTSTGAVVMNGNVVSGFLLGAQVHEEGQLIDPVTSEFAGSIRLMPATA
jgi:hypothetical protein